MSDTYERPLWFVVPADGSAPQEFRNPTRAHTALMMLTGPGHIESQPPGGGPRTITVTRDADGHMETPAPIITDLRAALDDLGRGDLTFDALIRHFEQATFRLPPRPKDWGEVYLRAEEGPHDDDVPAHLNSAKFARLISQRQYDTLISIYRERMGFRPGAATARKCHLCRFARVDRVAYAVAKLPRSSDNCWYDVCEEHFESRGCVLGEDQGRLLEPN